MRYKSGKLQFDDSRQTEAGDFSIKFFRYRATTSQRAEARWLVVERYLKNLIEKSPASVCLKPLNFSDLMLISMGQVTYSCIRYNCVRIPSYNSPPKKKFFFGGECDRFCAFFLFFLFVCVRHRPK